VLYNLFEAKTWRGFRCRACQSGQASLLGLQVACVTLHQCTPQEQKILTTQSRTFFAAINTTSST
jgi:hypothetical protein